MPSWRGPVDSELDAEKHRGVPHRAHAHPRWRAQEGPVRAGPRRRRAKACVQKFKHDCRSTFICYYQMGYLDQLFFFRTNFQKKPHETFWIQDRLLLVFRKLSWYDQAWAGATLGQPTHVDYIQHERTHERHRSALRQVFFCPHAPTRARLFWIEYSPDHENR